MRRLLWLVSLLMLVASIAPAQIVNPSSVTFDHPDFATASTYFGAYFALPVKADNTCDLAAPPAATATQTDQWAKPTTGTGVGIALPLLAKPIGCYVMKVRGLDTSGLYSPWSDPSDPFRKDPAKPGKPAPK